MTYHNQSFGVMEDSQTFNSRYLEYIVRMNPMTEENACKVYCERCKS